MLYIDLPNGQRTHWPPVRDKNANYGWSQTRALEESFAFFQRRKHLHRTGPGEITGTNRHHLVHELSSKTTSYVFRRKTGGVYKNNRGRAVCYLAFRVDLSGFATRAQDEETIYLRLDRGCIFSRLSRAMESTVRSTASHRARERKLAEAVTQLEERTGCALWATHRADSEKKTVWSCKDTASRLEVTSVYERDLATDYPAIHRLPEELAQQLQRCAQLNARGWRIQRQLNAARYLWVNHMVYPQLPSLRGLEYQEVPTYAVITYPGKQVQVLLADMFRHSASTVEFEWLSQPTSTQRGVGGGDPVLGPAWFFEYDADSMQLRRVNE